MKRTVQFVIVAGVAMLLFRSAYLAYFHHPVKHSDACGSIWNGRPRDEIEREHTIFADDGVLFLNDYCGKGTRTYLDFEGFPFKSRLKNYWIQFFGNASVDDIKRIAAHYGLDSGKVSAMAEGTILENGKVRFLKDINGGSVLSFKKEK